MGKGKESRKKRKREREVEFSTKKVKSRKLNNNSKGENVEEEAPQEEEKKKKVTKTLDNTREYDETIVLPDDQEVLKDEEVDEFAEFFKGDKPPSILITTCTSPTPASINFVKELLPVFPNASFYKRGAFRLQDIVKWADSKNFTDVIVINENRKIPNALLLVHLPNGPTAHFKLTGIQPSKEIEGHGKCSDKNAPELLLNNFNTRLGHSVGRMFATLLPKTPNFRMRRVVCFHNQRDFIFFRHHRYIFEAKDKVRLQELGPRFCLKLKSLQHGTFDTNGEYEWVHKREMDTSRRRFFL